MKSITTVFGPARRDAVVAAAVRRAQGRE